MSSSARASAEQILLVRHGETEMSATGAFGSRTDAPLSANGTVQATAWRPGLALFRVAGFSSPLLRATDTARLAGLTTAVILDDLREWDLGTLEGQHANSYRLAHPAWNLFATGPPDGSGERIEDVRARAQRAVERLRAHSTNGLVVAVSHGQFIKVMATVLLDLPTSTAQRFSVGPARGCLFTLRGGGYSLTGWNFGSENAPHLTSQLT